MNADQQSQLEALKGSALTQAEIDMANGREDGTLALSIFAGHTMLVSHLITERGIISALGPILGDQFLTSVEGFVAAGHDAANPLIQPYFGAIRRMADWLKPGAQGIDLGDRATQQLLTSLAALGYIQAAWAMALNTLPEVTSPVQLDAVTTILSGA